VLGKNVPADLLRELHEFKRQALHGVVWVNLGGGGQSQALFDGRK
jgi:hypothetical protein